MGEGRLRERKKKSNGSYILEIFITSFTLKTFKVGVISFYLFIFFLAKFLIKIKK